LILVWDVFEHHTVERHKFADKLQHSLDVCACVVQPGMCCNDIA